MTADLAIDVVRVPVEAILDLREHYRREMRCQIVHDSWHARGFTHSYHALLDGQIVGYGSVGGAPGEPKTTIKEFFVVPSARWAAEALFRRLIVTSGARTIESQTNDSFLSPLLYDCATDFTSHTILFSDGATTNHTAPGILRRVTEAERENVVPHEREPVGDWGIEYDRRLVATGGLFFHYNPPYGDLYMEVSAPYRLKGFGSYLVQELKRMCRQGGHIPAARCDTSNGASRRTLERAGMLQCGRIVRGTIAV